MTARKSALAVLAIATLTVPASAVAKTRTKTVNLGPPPAVSKALGKATGGVPADVNAYFPGKTTIHPGDKVKFVPFGFHDVSIPAKGEQPPSVIVPTGQSADEQDAAGNPFWFNGQPLVGFNPALVTVNGFTGKAATFSAAKGYETGLPLADKPKPAIVRFTKKGTYRFYCAVHPGMAGTVKVKKGKIPSAKADAKRIAKQGKAAVSAAKKLTQETVPANQMALGAAGAGGVELFAFLPQSLSVPAGTTVGFQMPAGSLEIHTATSGPGDIEDASSYLGGLAKSFESPAIAGAAVYPSDPPPAVPELTTTSHGNGFVNTGVLDTDDDSPQPATSSIKFTQAGTFTLYCLVHPFMVGTVTVQ